jgi:hypothetical protein
MITVEWELKKSRVQGFMRQLWPRGNAARIREALVSMHCAYRIELTFVMRTDLGNFLRVKALAEDAWASS